ncbi:MAG: GNAT family N-acetyltransferase [Pseudomonadaceae bacterium]|nr:GNAT family N-acetyltransferase [Pseudomonadaceae bacterium]
MFPEGLLPEHSNGLDQEVLTAAVEAEQLIVADVDSQVVGFALTGMLDNYLHLYEMSVHPDFGRRGIGRKLVNATKAAAAASSLPGITLTTFSHIPWNAPFYQRCGFQILSETQISPELKKILQQEADDGFTHRVAMRTLLT